MVGYEGCTEYGIDERVAKVVVDTMEEGVGVAARGVACRLFPALTRGMSLADSIRYYYCRLNFGPNYCD